jgi:sn-glycerol 3-phosphate transport system substrate-binding protein
LKAWQKEKIWIYGGRKNDAESLFINGIAAMITRSSAAHAVTRRDAKFEFGVGNLPYWPDVPGAPQNSIIGGASLWVMAGHKSEEYKAVAAFFRFLSLPMVQAFWHEYTGYVPITNTAFQLMKDIGFYKKNPGRDLPILQLGGKDPTKISRGLRFGNFIQMRAILNEEMEAIWKDLKTPKQALDDAVKRGNDLLRKFEQSQQ